PRGAADHLLARDLLHEIRIFRAVLQKLDTMFEPTAPACKRGKLLLVDRQPMADIGKGNQPARTPDQVITEIEDRGRRHGGYHKDAKEPRHAKSDSHVANES